MTQICFFGPMQYVLRSCTQYWCAHLSVGVNSPTAINQGHCSSQISFTQEVLLPKFFAQEVLLPNCCLFREVTTSTRVPNQYDFSTHILTYCLLNLCAGVVVPLSPDLAVTVPVIRCHCDWLIGPLGVVDTSCKRQDRPGALQVHVLTAAYCILPHGKLCCNFTEGFPSRKTLSKRKERKEGEEEESLSDTFPSLELKHLWF